MIRKQLFVTGRLKETQVEIKLEKVKNANGQSRKAHGLAKIPAEDAIL
jgi:hypothetical protein